MEEKKQRLIESSIELFAEKGYHRTSIQEIVEKSGVSKGAFYLYFSSKKALTTEIVDYFINKMVRDVKEINEKQIGPKEKLIEQTALYLDVVNHHRSHVLMSLKDQTLEGQDFEGMIKRLHKESYRLMQNRMQEYYGEAVVAYVPDIFIIYDGIMQGYLKAIIIYQVACDPNEMARFIIDRLMAMIHDLMQTADAPMLTAHDLDVQATPVVSDLIQKAYALDVSNEKKDEVIEAIQLLEQECVKEKPNQVIIESVKATLFQWDLLKSDVDKLSKKGM